MHFEWPESLLRASSSDELEVVLESTRSILYLTVDWSVFERKARQIFVEFSRQIGDVPRALIAIADENNIDIRELLSSQYCDVETAHGAGSVLWLENGEVVDGVLSAARCDVAELIAKTVSRWKK